MTAQHRLGQTDSGRIRIVVSIPACHAGGRGSIPRCGAHQFLALLFDCIKLHVLILGALSLHKTVMNKAQDLVHFEYLAGPEYFVAECEKSFTGYQIPANSDSIAADWS